MFRDHSIKLDETKSIQFQVTDWFHTDLQDDDNNDREYIIKMFGVTEEGYSICANVKDFQPYFYISAKSKATLNQSEIYSLKEQIMKNLPSSFKESVTFEEVNKKSIWGFTNNSYKQYIKLSFKNLTCMYIVRKMLQKKMKLVSLNTNFQFHESNIDAFLRFIHNQNIKPGGWVTIDCFDQDVGELETKCQINIQASCCDVNPYESSKFAPIVIMSFDIECTSSSGDFPVPIKTYRKTADELIQYFNSLNRYSDSCWAEYEKPLLVSALMSIFDVDNPNVCLTKVHTKAKTVNLESILEKLLNKFENIGDILKNKIKVDADKFMEDYGLQPTKLNQLEIELNKIFPKLKGDAIIQIGTTVHRYGDMSCVYKNIITLDTCDPIEGVEVITCKTETKLIKEWCKLLLKIDPDIITGYNILGFDFYYLYNRALERGCEESILTCGRLEGHQSQFKEKTLASSALGENILRYVEMEGRVFIDLMKVVQREYKLDSYKLDNVASHFISGVVKKQNGNEITLDSTAGINCGDYIKLNDEKVMVTSVDNNVITTNISPDIVVKTWGLAKDDVSPKEIFQCQKGTSTDRAKIAKYCVQDCALCNMLIIKLEVIANNMGMANVCLVPLSYIFMRGQGIKIFSLVAKQCKDDNFIIPLLKYVDPKDVAKMNKLNGVKEEDVNDEEEVEGYEGAIVLDPKPGIYVEAPISVMDYASLYPSSMISENISHDSIVLDKKFDNLEGIDYVDITYDIFTGVGDKKKKTGEKVCRYAQFKNNKKGVLPRILMKLLSERKATRKQAQHKTVTTILDEEYIGLVSDTEEGITIKTVDNKTVNLKSLQIKSIIDTYNDFNKAILDGLQLAYKITANSLYGQVGARTSPIYMKELAASTTATGRNLILKAKKFMEDYYDADVVYGDTDSIFVDFKIKEKYELEDKEALQKSIDICIEASNNFKKELKAPHDLEYEKTFFPFIILSKKKYVGNLYEFDVNKYKQKSMGIVLKRRDNANIVKVVYGGIIDILLNKQNIKFAIEFLKKSLDELVEGKFSMENLIITKTLRTTYKDPTKIAHKVLADRMKERDPGSAPQTNDRVPYVYVEHDIKNKSLLQGDKIEHPDYIKENSVKIDYIFYITNQLMKPICQLLSVALQEIPYSLPIEHYERKEKWLSSEYGGNAKKAKDKIADLKNSEVKKLLFDDILTKLNNKRLGNRPITDFFKII
jgi:DNA polymerase elongation subunit (family B)